MPLGPGGRELEWQGKRGQRVEQEPEDLGERATAIHVVMGRGLGRGLPLLAWLAPPSASLPCPSRAGHGPPRPPCRVRPRGLHQGQKAAVSPPICLSRS